MAAITSNLRLAEAPGNVFLDQLESGLPRDSVVNVTQVLALDRSFFTAHVSALPEQSMAAIDAGLRLVLGL